MHRWFNSSPLFNAAGDASGSDTIYDPGIPHEHSHEPEVKEAPKPVKSAEAIELESFKARLTAAERRAEQAESDAQFWAARGRRQDAEVIEEPVRREQPPAVAVKPEKLMDDLTAEGLEGARKNGLITKADLDAILAEKTEEIRGAIKAERADAEFGARIANEFPEIAEDSRRLERGEKPQSELFRLAGEIYRGLVADDSTLKGTNGALLIAARQAKAQIKAKVKEEPVRTDPDRQDRRRERIDRQRGERTVTGGEGDESHEDGFSKSQLDVMSKLNVKPDEFRKHVKVGTNGR